MSRVTWRASEGTDPGRSTGASGSDASDASKGAARPDTDIPTEETPHHESTYSASGAAGADARSGADGAPTAESAQLLEDLRALLCDALHAAREWLGAGDETEQDVSCPGCAMLETLRGTRPEFARLLTELLRVLRETLSSFDCANTGADAGADFGQESRGAMVEHIAVHRVTGPVLAESDDSPGEHER